MGREELLEMLEEGYEDVLTCRTRPAADVFADLAKEYGTLTFGCSGRSLLLLALACEAKERE